LKEKGAEWPKMQPRIPELSEKPRSRKTGEILAGGVSLSAGRSCGNFLQPGKPKSRKGREMVCQLGRQANRGRCEKRLLGAGKKTTPRRLQKGGEDARKRSSTGGLERAVPPFAREREAHEKGLFISQEKPRGKKLGVKGTGLLLALMNEIITRGGSLSEGGKSLGGLARWGITLIRIALRLGARTGRISD